MKINFATVLRDFVGNPMLEKLEDGKSRKLTLGAVVIGAATSPVQGIQMPTSLKRFKIAKLAAKGGKQELADDLVDEMRRAVHQRYGGNPVVIGRVCEIVGEPKEAPPPAPRAAPAKPAPKPAPKRKSAR